MTKKAHSDFGASNCERWFNCPGSVNLINSLDLPEEEPSGYATEGVYAHSLGEHCLKTGDDPLDYACGEFNGSMVEPELALAVKTYVDYCNMHTGDYVEIEKSYTMQHISKKMWGTADFTTFTIETGVLHVVDYKHGAGVSVSVEDNKQLLYYASGAMQFFRTQYQADIKSIILTIIQPRAPGDAIKSCIVSPEDIAAFEDALIVALGRAGKKKALLAAGSWCRWCPAKAVCTAYRDQNTRLLTPVVAEDDSGIFLPDVELLKAGDITTILDNAPAIKEWLKSVESYAMSQLNAGHSIPGYKIVKKKGNRAWEEETVAKKFFEENLDPSVFIKVVLKSPAQVETGLKSIGKTKTEIADIISPFIIQPESLGLAPDTDPRPSELVEFTVINDTVTV